MNDDTGPDTVAPPQRAGFLPALAGSRIPHSPFAFMDDRIVQAAREAIITVDEDQRVVMINPAAQRLFGYSAPDALGKNLSLFIPPRYRKEHPAYVRRFDQSGTVERPMGGRSNVTGLRANGQEFPIEATISRLDVIDSMGPRRFFTALMRDLTEVNDLRGEIEALNCRLRSIFEVAPIAIWIIEDELIVFANNACAALFGVADRSDLVGHSIYALLGTGSQTLVREAITQALAVPEKPVSELNQQIARPDGTVREVDIAVAALPDHGKTTLQMVITDITILTQESRDLEISRQELRQLSASLVDAREEERRRIARELHDELGQRLTALQMELSSLKRPGSAVAVNERIDGMLGMVDETVATVRRIATELRPLMLDDLGLISAVEWLAESWARRMGISVKLDLGTQDPEVAQTTTIALYRMVQEALTNIARHARATRVKIQMRPRAGELVLTVQDNGVGFSERSMHREGSHGLMGIRERAYMLGGHLEIGNTRAGGGRITVRLPLTAPVGAGPAATAPPPEHAAPTGRSGLRGKTAP